jgi:hypothetical protein
MYITFAGNTPTIDDVKGSNVFGHFSKNILVVELHHFFSMF